MTKEKQNFGLDPKKRQNFGQSNLKFNLKVPYYNLKKAHLKISV